MVVCFNPCRLKPEAARNVPAAGRDQGHTGTIAIAERSQQAANMEMLRNFVANSSKCHVPVV